MPELPKPSFRNQTWSIRDNPEIRVKLTERPGINLYTSIEKPHEDVDGVWITVTDSSQGHGNRPESMEAAEARVLHLLEGAWRGYFPALASPGEPSLEEILRRPYARTFLRNEQGVFTALILEFPGCIAEARYIEQAYEALEEAAISWILAMQANRNPIPEPFESNTTSINNLQKLWMAVDKWRQEFPVASPEELSRAIIKIVTPRSATTP